MLSKANTAARRARASHLRQTLAAEPRCPRRRLTKQVSLLAALVLISPLWSSTDLTVAMEADGFGGGDSVLAIDSPTFTLENLPVTADGFLIKTGRQTAQVDRSGLHDIITYHVEEGDSLSSIARKFGVSQDTIVWENNLVNPHSLKAGTELAILPVDGVSHAVKSGETLADVASRYGVKAETIAKQNGLSESATLTADAKLIVPGARKVVSTYVASSGSTRTYAAYRAGSTVDGAVIISNAASDKEGKWMVKPTKGVYTTYFGGRAGHWAVDIADRGMPDIIAAADGTVIKSQCGWNGGYGCMVVLDHGDGVQTLYGHLNRIDVAVGDGVTQGDTLGQMGATGRVYGKTGIHLHFEVIDNGRKKNPLAYYSE